MSPDEKDLAKARKAYTDRLPAAERRPLARLLRTASNATSAQAADQMRRDGLDPSRYETAEAMRLVDSLEQRHGVADVGNDSGPIRTEWVTVALASLGTDVPRRSITEWAVGGEIRGEPVELGKGRVLWFVFLDDVKKRANMRKARK